MLSHLIEVLGCREHSQLPLVPRNVLRNVRFVNKCGDKCEDRVVAQFGFRALFGLRRPFRIRLPLRAWRRFCTVAANRWNTRARGKRRHTCHRHQMRKGRRSPNDYAATLLRPPRSFVLDFLVRPITLERGST